MMMEKRTGICQEALKLLAVITMLIDHIGATFYPDRMILRYVGRLAMPIFAFCIVEGFCKTHRRGRYFWRLTVFALLSELPFDRMVSGKLWDPEQQNILWTFLLAFLAMAALEYTGRRPALWAPGIACVLLCCLAAEWAGTDYGAFSVLLCLLFYLTREMRLGLLWSAAGFLILCVARYGYLLPARLPAEIYGVLATPLLAFYRGYRRGNRWIQYGFYCFYPCHMLILGLLR